MKFKNYEIPKLENKIIVITGSNSGIGLFVAKEFLKYNAKVVFACRNVEKAKEEIKKIRKEIPTSKIGLVELDLMSFDSVKKASRILKKRISHIDILIHNAGVIFKNPYELSKDGFEPHLAVNCLSPFLLTLELFPLLRKSQNARVVTVASIAEKFIKFDPAELENIDSINIKSYAKSKAAALILNKHLGRILDQNNITNIKTVSSHPGLTYTKSDQIKGFFNKIFIKLLGQPLEKGAMSLIVAATYDKANNGDYFGYSHFFNLKGSVVLNRSSKMSYDINKSEKLWNICEKLVGESLNIQGNLF